VLLGLFGQRGGDRRQRRRIDVGAAEVRYRIFTPGS
jgi:hypothetical protein